MHFFKSVEHLVQYRNFIYEKTQKIDCFRKVIKIIKKFPLFIGFYLVLTVFSVSFFYFTYLPVFPQKVLIAINISSYISLKTSLICKCDDTCLVLIDFLPKIDVYNTAIYMKTLCEQWTIQTYLMTASFNLIVLTQGCGEKGPTEKQEKKLQWKR